MLCVIQKKKKKKTENQTCLILRAKLFWKKKTYIYGSKYIWSKVANQFLIPQVIDQLSKT